METSYHNVTEYQRTVKNSENPYLTLSTKLTNDSRLNVIDKGILLDIFNNSDEYIFNANYMQKKSGIGKVQYQKSINKLIELGYIRKERIQCGVKWIFCEDSTIKLTNTIKKEKELVTEHENESDTIQEHTEQIKEINNQKENENEIMKTKEEIEEAKEKLTINKYQLENILEDNGIDKSMIKLVMLFKLNARMMKDEINQYNNNIDKYNSIISQYQIIN